ncbi:hypothetical protein RND81_09G136400 [Saponaria officinalis]|uniref:DUF4283 domain-containing protein n=1 Tax=Saponaria officinalis TaxID=3572 RepID=A0AAW1IKF5_SAPOF
MARGRSRPPKGRPLGEPSPSGAPSGTNNSVFPSSFVNTHISPSRNSVLLNDIIVNALQSSMDAGVNTPPIVGVNSPPIGGIAGGSEGIVSSLVVNLVGDSVTPPPVVAPVVSETQTGGTGEAAVCSGVPADKPRWSEVVRSRSQEGMSLFFSEESQASEEIDIVVEDIADELKLWQFTLMGNVIGARPTLKQIVTFVEKSWRHLASPIVQYYQKGWFSFRFTTKVEMDNVLKEGPWRVGLDPYMWSDIILSKIASKVGRPLFADKTTTTKARLSFARVMVEVDVAKPLVEHVFLNTSFNGAYAQSVEYEWVPYYCSCCDSSNKIPQSGVEKSGLECDKLGLDSSSPGQESFVLEAVKHSGSSELGTFPHCEADTFSLVTGSNRSSKRPLAEPGSNPLITVNRYDVLNIGDEPPIAIVEDWRNKLDVYGILETRVKDRRAQKIAKKFSSNDAHVREALWSSLVRLSGLVQDWIVLGDFNVVRDAQERVSESASPLADILAFNACLLRCGLDDIKSMGCFLTWTNKQENSKRVWSKLDRALVNPSWLATFHSSSANFLPSGVSDHSPCLGNAMFSFFAKLKNVRFALTKLHRCNFSSIQQRILDAKQALEECQLAMKMQPSCTFLHQQEHKLLTTYLKLRGIIGEINDHHGMLRAGLDNVAASFVDYYASLLGSSTHVQSLDDIFIAHDVCLEDCIWQPLIEPVREEEIKSALMTIDTMKSPGPDGFSSAFFIRSWDIIGHDL